MNQFCEKLLIKKNYVLCSMLKKKMTVLTQVLYLESLFFSICLRDKFFIHTGNYTWYKCVMFPKNALWCIGNSDRITFCCVYESIFQFTIHCCPYIHVSLYTQTFKHINVKVMISVIVLRLDIPKQWTNSLSYSAKPIR